MRRRPLEGVEMESSKWTVVWSSMVVGAALFAACGGGNNGPSSPNTPVAPAPTPTPAPAPTPTPIPGATCALGFGSSRQPTCSRQSPAFLDEVDEAIDRLVAENPAIFNRNDSRGPGGFFVLSTGQFYVGVVQNLEAMGFCATFDGEEVALKNSNDFSEQYHLVISSGHVRRGNSSYRATCRPAALEAPPRLPETPAGCTLSGSYSLTCGRERPSFLTQVDQAIDQLAREHPELFDAGSNPVPGDAYRVRNVNGYVQGVAEILKARGICAIWDGGGAGGQEREPPLRPVRHPACGRRGPARRGVVPDDLLPGRVLAPVRTASRHRRARAPSS